MKTIRFTNKESGVRLRAKVKYGNCSQLDNLRIAARQASIKLDIQERQPATAKAEIAAYDKAIAWHVNHTNEMHGEIAEYRKCLSEIKGINAPADCFTDTEWYALVGIHDLLAKHKGE